MHVPGHLDRGGFQLMAKVLNPELSGARGVLEGPCSAEHERLGQGWGPAGKSQRPFGGRLRLCFLHALEEAVPGGAGRDRTGDLLNAIQALSQLSYGPTRDGQANPPHGVLSKGHFLKASWPENKSVVRYDAARCRSGETGIRRGLKIPRSQGRAGSNPASGTTVYRRLSLPSPRTGATSLQEGSERRENFNEKGENDEVESCSGSFAHCGQSSFGTGPRSSADERIYGTD